MSWREVTGLVIILLIVIVCVYDLLVEVFGGNEATISRITYETAKLHPMVMVGVSVLFGMLLGHLFVPQHIEKAADARAKMRIQGKE